MKKKHEKNTVRTIAKSHALFCTSLVTKYKLEVVRPSIQYNVRPRALRYLKKIAKLIVKPYM